MYLHPDIKFQGRLVQWSKYFSSAITVIALSVLIGWQFDIELLKRPVPGMGAMIPASAILFILVAVSFKLLTAKTKSRQVRWCGYFFAGLILLIAGAKLISFLTNPGFRIDDFLFYKKFAAEPYLTAPKSIALVTATCFFLTAISLLVLNTRVSVKKPPVQYIAIIILLTAVFSVIGYLYHAGSFYDPGYYNPMPLYSAICFVLISLAILFAKPAQGIMKQFTSIHTGSITARLLIPTALLLPFIFGWIFHYGSRFELYTPEFSSVLFVLVIILIFFVALWYNTILLNERDLQRRETEKALKESQEQVDAIFRSAPDAVIIMDEEGRILQWNKQAQSLFGWAKPEVWYERFINFIIPHRYREEYKQGWQSFIKTGKSRIFDTALELKGLKKDNSEIDISLSISPTMLKNKYLFVGFIRNITERKKTEEQ